MKKRILPIIILVISFSSIFAQVNITFELNAATLNNNIDPGGLYIAGGSGFGVPGDNELTDPDGDGIYTITLQRDAGFSSYYTFLNGNCPDWSCKENIAGLPCANPDNFNDRFLPEVTEDVTVKACFGTCDDDGGCTVVLDSISLTFELNTASIGTVDPGGIFLAGGGNFGNPGDNPMVDPDGDGIYTITVTKPAGFSSHYTFLNGNCGDWSCKEDLAGLPCGDPDNFNDRFLPATMESTTIKACFGACDSDGTCASVSVKGLEIDQSLFTLQPSLAHDFTKIIFGENTLGQKKQIHVLNGLGQLVHTTNIHNESIYLLDTADYSGGLYFLTIKTEKTILTRKFIVQK